MDRIYGYPSVYALGHNAILDIFDSPVIVEEKVDGSQFSFGVFDGELLCRSKGKQIVLDAPEKMFTKAIKTAGDLVPILMPETIYRCEYVSSPKHNTLVYGRTPEKFLIIFDISTGVETYLNYEDKNKEAGRLGLECVPLLFEGKISSVDELKALLDNDSVLGNTKIEGVVVKNPHKFTVDKKMYCGKLVSERFKEIHGVEWKKSNPTSKDVLTTITESYRTEARWQKAVQHLRDSGRLTNSPADIGALIKEVQRDIGEDSAYDIKEFLYHHFIGNILRGTIRGLPEWYKEQLAQRSFENLDG